MTNKPPILQTLRFPVVFCRVGGLFCFIRIVLGQLSGQFNHTFTIHVPPFAAPFLEITDFFFGSSANVLRGNPDPCITGTAPYT